MKRVVSILMAGLLLLPLLLSCLSCRRAAPEDFESVLRFAIASDVHIADGGSALQERRLALLLERAYEHAAQSEGEHKTLDAVLFAGDITDSGTRTQMQLFEQILSEGLQEGTQVLLSLGNHDFYEEPENTVRDFTEVFGCAEDGHTVVGGFHFIRLSPDEGDYYGEEKQAWLARELKAASEAAPGMPIFVMQHHPVSNTVYGSERYWGKDDLKAVLAKYPQVVDISGHSHFPIIDPRSLWQGEFTAIGTGTLSHCELGIIGESPDFRFPTNSVGGWSSGDALHSADSAQFQIVEVGERGQLRIIGYDLLVNEQIFTRYVLSPADPASFVTNAQKTAAAATPAFAVGASMQVSNQSAKGFTLTIPQATCENTPIESYRVEVYDGSGVCYGIYRVLSGYHHLPAPRHVRCDVAYLSGDQAWTVQVFAVNSYGLESPPLELTVHTV